MSASRGSAREEAGRVADGRQTGKRCDAGKKGACFAAAGVTAIKAAEIMHQCRKALRRIAHVACSDSGCVMLGGSSAVAAYQSLISIAWGNVALWTASVVLDLALPLVLSL